MCRCRAKLPHTRLRPHPHLQSLPYAPLLPTPGDKPYVTDNSNYIVDLYFEEPIKDAHAGGRRRRRWGGRVLCCQCCVRWKERAGGRQQGHTWQQQEDGRQGRGGLEGTMRAAALERTCMAARVGAGGGCSGVVGAAGGWSCGGDALREPCSAAPSRCRPPTHPGNPSPLPKPSALGNP
jgi:hypothetical protein